MSYRQFVTHGPHVPQELLHALEEERLVFFCGAGISAPDLPNFRGLVDEVLDHFAVPRHGENLEGQWVCMPDDPVLGAAYRREEYDKVLNILEDREGSAGRMRLFTIERLTRDPLIEKELPSIPPYSISPASDPIRFTASAVSVWLLQILTTGFSEQVWTFVG